jgi:hypothetical protein
MTGNRVTDPARRQKSSKSPAQHRSLSNWQKLDPIVGLDKEW